MATISLLVSITEPATAYTPHAPIYIAGNGGFTPANGVTGGSGTPSDPYIIEGWEVNVTSWSQDGISIANTDAHLILRNVRIKAACGSLDPFNERWKMGCDIPSSISGIRLHEVANVRIENVTAWESEHGIRVGSSSNVTIEGSTVHSSVANGIIIQESAGVTIRDTNISYNSRGIHLLSSSNITITGSIMHGNLNGILLDTSTNVTITNNTLASEGITLSGETLRHFNTHTITQDNRVNDKPVRYHRDCNGLALDGLPVGQLILASCSDVRIANLTIDDTDVSIQAFYTDGVSISGITASKAGTAIKLYASANVTIRGSSIMSGGTGVFSHSSFRITIADNILADNRRGIELYTSNESAIEDNQITGNVYGVWVELSSDLAISNNEVTSNEQYGILLDKSTDVTAADNRISSYRKKGLHLLESTNIVLTGNAFLSDGVLITGHSLPEYNSHTFATDNRVNGKPLQYHKDCSGLDIEGVAIGQLIVANCTGVRVTGLHLNETSTAIQMAYVEGAVISDSGVSDSLGGIRIYESEGIEITGSRFLSSNGSGISITSSSYVNISGNTVSANSHGIRLEGLRDSTIKENNVTANRVLGVDLHDGRRVRLYHNNFINNTEQAREQGSYDVTWDNGFPAGGNYWSDYNGSDDCSCPGQTVCTDSDGIGDTPYEVWSGGQDDYPLMQPFDSRFIPPPACPAPGPALALIALLAATVILALLLIRRKWMAPRKPPSEEE